MPHINRYAFPELWAEMGTLQDELNRLFHRFNATGRAASPLAPAVNIWEDEHNVYAQTDLPGFDPAKLEVFVTEGNQLTIHGERSAPEPKGAVWHRQERGFGRIERVLTLPSLVDADKVEAQFADGVLTLTLPKSEAARPRKIAVKAV
jgi:HSP20 family protein